MRNALTVLAALYAAAAVADRYPFERYQTILDRQMFGPPPPGFDPTKMPSEVAKTSARGEAELSQEQEQVKRAVRFSVLNVTASGEPVVGFTDSADPKNPMHYYLKVGESQNGWTVKSADPEAATMTIEKEGVEVTLKLGGDSSGAAPGAPAGRRDARGAPSPLLAGAKLSLRERRRQQEEQMREDAAKRAEEEKARAAREEEENNRRAAEREEQRKQLLLIQEELRRAREAREAQKAAEQPSSDGEASDS